MRQVTRKISQAFHSRSRLSISNTTTDGNAVWLFGNKIIERRSDGIYFSLAGYNTVTTRERINGVLEGYVRVSTKNGQAFIQTPTHKAFINTSDWICANSVQVGS